MDKEPNKSEHLSNEEVFRRNAFQIIIEMVELSNQTREDTSVLVDEILHSIFFLGEINRPKFSPKRLLDDNEEIYDHLRDRYPQPFSLYSSQIPRRSPFSCVLDMIVQVVGQENEDEIKLKLQTLSHQLMQNAELQILVSSTICISRINIPGSKRYYGVSMSTKGRPAGQIMVAASSFSYWDDYVADAVMTYCPKKTKKPYFDGTFQLHAEVSCQAYNIRKGIEMDPCRSCGNLFGLQSPEKEKHWPYGNCAEVESVSNLLKNENRVRENVQPRPEENRQRAKDEVSKHLKNLLKNQVQFNWDGVFYCPESVRDEEEETEEEETEEEETE
ncbi:uncharacterized protein PAE49_020756 [Odontesthes bonariensis]|uniref:uncharacterized protein LOC142367467 n=1 Tax=Odontesthes bonariensis TaxID=219752 RepID=UPI003F582942